MQVVLSLDCGGLEKVSIGIASKLNSSKYRPSICCLDNAGDLAEQAEKMGIKVIVAGRKPGIDFSLLPRLAKILKQEKIDIVHTHNPGALIYGTLAAKLAGIPVIVNTRHGRAKRRVNGLIWNMNSAVIAISEDAKERLLKHNRLNSNKLKVIYNGVETKHFRNVVNAKTKKQLLNIDKSRLVIGTVSRLSEEKDQLILIDSLARVSQVFDNVVLVFVGDGPLRSKLKKHAEKTGVKNKVIFLGFRKDVAKIINTFDIFTLSSLMEGVSVSLLEAMAAGKPVVVTNVGGNPEVVVDGETGFLIPPKNPDKTAEAMIKLLKNPELAKRMGNAGRKRVEEKFSLDKMVKGYKELYDHYLNKKGTYGKANN
ncbi:MAG: glycosyltransferase [Planctomycetota bacterium]